MIYEKRKYTVADGRMGELIERFEKHTLRLFKKYNMKSSVLGVSRENENEFFYILEFENKEEMERSWKGFIEDEERTKIWDKSNKNGKLVLKVRSEIYEKITFD